jgi:hypothetical protein
MFMCVCVRVRVRVCVRTFVCRGALWTAPTGLLLYVLGYGALPLLSGTCMGIWCVDVGPLGGPVL